MIGPNGVGLIEAMAKATSWKEPKSMLNYIRYMSSDRNFLMAHQKLDIITTYLYHVAPKSRHSMLKMHIRNQQT